MIVTYDKGVANEYRRAAMASYASINDSVCVRVEDDRLVDVIIDRPRLRVESSRPTGPFGSASAK